MAENLEPVDIELAGKTYVLTKFGCITGREIIVQYPTSALPKIGDYKTNEDLMLKIMKYVGVRIDGRDEPQMLINAQLVENHIASTDTLMRLEWAMMTHNFDFFKNGVLSGLLERVASQAVGSMSKILMDLSRVSSVKPGTAAQP